MEIEKLERRKARYLERSPSPHSATSPTPPEAAAGILTRVPSPTLPLPSTQPQGAALRVPESGTKAMFTTSLGLWRLSEEEKQGIVFSNCLHS